MILFPAIDLKDGQCVRLQLGEMSSAKVFNDDPGAQARAFQDQDWVAHALQLGLVGSEALEGFESSSEL